MQNPTIVNDVNIYTRGDVKNNAMVFIHGNSLSSLTFKKQFELLPQHIPLVAFDLPGHGFSARHDDYEDVYCIPGYIRTLQTVIKSLGLNDFILAGHSLGGHIAIEAAEQLESLKALVVFGTPPIGMPPEMDKMFLPNPQMGSLFSKQMNPDDALTIAKEFVHKDDNLVNELAEMVIATDGNARENLGASIGKGQFGNEKEILKKLNIPIAILNGEKEKLVNSNYLNELEIPKLWSKKIITIKNAGHTIQIENHQDFNSILLDFYKAVF